MNAELNSVKFFSFFRSTQVKVNSMLLKVAREQTNKHFIPQKKNKWFLNISSARCEFIIFFGFAQKPCNKKKLSEKKNLRKNFFIKQKCAPARISQSVSQSRVCVIFFFRAFYSKNINFFPECLKVYRDPSSIISSIIIIVEPKKIRNFLFVFIFTRFEQLQSMIDTISLWNKEN